MYENDFSKELKRMEQQKLSNAQTEAAQRLNQSITSSHLDDCRRTRVGTAPEDIFNETDLSVLHDFEQEARNRGHAGSVAVKFGKFMTGNSWKGRAYILGAVSINGAGQNALLFCDDGRLRATPPQSVTTPYPKMPIKLGTVEFGAVPTGAGFKSGSFSFGYETVDSTIQKSMFKEEPLTTVLAEQLVK